MRHAHSLAVVVLATISAGFAAGRDHDSCLLPDSSHKRSEYCESVPLGSHKATKVPANYSVTLKSEFFKGLKRIRSPKGFDFVKDGHAVAKYPEQLTIEVSTTFSEIDLSRRLVPGKPARPAAQEVPRRVVLRWHDATGKVLETRSVDLEEVVEPWPELSQPQVWYRATISGVDQLLSGELETLVFTRGETPVEVVMTCSLGLCSGK